MKQLQHKLKRAIAFLLVLLFVVPCLTVNAVQSEKETRQTVRVAFPQQAGFSEVGIGGNYTGYTYEYLEKIAEFSGIRFEYITFDDLSIDDSIVAAMEMVRTGEADLIGGLVKSEALEQEYEFCNNSYGVVYTTIASLENNIAVSEDTFRLISPLKVAVFEQATTRNAELCKYLDKEEVSYELISCVSRQEQIEALEHGLADVVSSISLSYFTGTKTLARFAARPYYFAATKENTELIEKLDDAQAEISYAFPYFQTRLQEKYFGDSAAGFSLSDEQKAMLQQKNRLKSSVLPIQRPM